MDPRARILLVLCAGLVGLALERPVSLLIFALLMAAPFLVIPVERRTALRVGLALLSVVWGTVLSQALFYAAQPRTPLLVLGPVTFWREGVLWGLAQSLRFIGLLLAGLALVRTTPVDRLYLALVALRLPFGVALMAATALRFLPVIGEELRQVRAARAARGRPIWARSPLAWLRLELRLLAPVVARSWRRASALAESLDARGFDPVAPRGTLRPLRWRWADSAVLGVVASATVGLCLARVLYLLYTAEALYIPALRPLYAVVRAWL